MREFFRGWRRKVGVCILMMACVLVGGWIRSATFKDELWFSKDPSPKQIFVQSCAGKLRFFFGSANSSISRGGYWWLTRNCTVADRSFTGFGVPFVFDGRWQLWRFEISKGHEVQQPPNTYVLLLTVIPYWSLVIPLALISAFLLLSTPSTNKSKSASDSIPETVVNHA